jgi:hypothetical protein
MRARPLLFRQTTGLAMVVMVLLGANALMDLAALWSSGEFIALVDRLIEEEKNPEAEPVAEADLDAHDDQEATLALTALGTLIATGVMWLVWWHKRYANLPALGATRLASTPGGAVGIWFIPILNLVRPYEIAQEMWRFTAPGEKPEPTREPPPVPPKAPPPVPPPAARRARRTTRLKSKGGARARARGGGSPLVLAWWLCWIGMGVLNVVAAWMVTGAIEEVSKTRGAYADYFGVPTGKTIEALESLQTATHFDQFANLVRAGVAVVAIVFVRKMEERQTAKWAEVQAAQAPPPEPTI